MKTKTQLQPHFMLIPSLSCPASCSYCFGPNSGPAMNIAVVDSLIDFMEATIWETGQKKLRVTLHGGEPLSAGYNVIEALICNLHDRFGSLDYSIGIQSNLWLLNERYCRLFSKYMVQLSTSLDGPQHLNDKQRGEGYFEKTVNGIRLARSYGIDAACVATFTPLTAPYWREIFDFFISEKLHFSVHPSLPSIEGKAHQVLDPDQYFKLFENMFGYYILQCKNIMIPSFDRLCQGVACNSGGVCTFQDCFGMFLAIDPWGDIYPCQRFAGKGEFRLGSIMERPSLRDLMSSPEAFKFIEREFKIWDECGSCQHYKICKGGCPYNALAQNSLIDPYCRAYKKMFSYIKDKIHEEMVSEENMKAIMQYGLSERGNPLLRRGTIIELMDEETHPCKRRDKVS